MFKNRLNYQLVNILLLMLVLYLGVSTIGVWGGLFLRFLGIIFPFIIAFAIAYGLHPFVKYLEKKGVRKQLAVTIIVISVLLLAAVLLSITLPLIYDQLILFSKMVIEVLQDISSKFDINLGDFQITISDTLNDLIKSLGTFISNGTFDLVGKGIDYITKTIIIIIVSIYFLADMDKIRKGTKEFLMSFKGRVFRYVKSLDYEIGQYFHGLIIFMLIQLVEYCLVFWIVGHPNWLLLGILACVTTIIPYFGGLITNIIAVITASVVSTPVFVGTIIICLIFPQLDGYVISPKIYGKTNNINPLWSIFAVMIGGSIGGFIGIVIALPIFILLNSTYHFFRQDIKRKMEQVKEAID